MMLAAGPFTRAIVVLQKKKTKNSSITIVLMIPEYIVNGLIFVNG
jgi:hypothetical protein